MLVAAEIAIAALVPLIVGVAGGMLAPKEDAATVAGICTGGIVGVVLVVGFATTPQSACGNTGCDTGYGLGAVLMFFPVFGVALAGVALGRLLGRRVRSRQS